MPPACGTYPTFYANSTGGSNPPGPGPTWNTVHFWILPYIEQDNLYKSAANPSTSGDFQPQVYPSSKAAAASKVKTFVCPSDPSINADGLPGEANPNDQQFVPGGQATATSYALNAQVFANIGPNNLPNGGQGSASVASTFSDGTSNTIVFAEKYACCNETASFWYRNNFFPSGYGPYFQAQSDVIGPNFSFQSKPSPYNSAACNPHLPSSSHTSVINVGLGDGSVRTVSSSITPTTWWYACTPSGGEVLPSDW